MRLARSARTAAALAVLSVSVAASALSAQGLPRDMTAWVARTLKTFQVPGMGVAVVKDGKVVLAQGYGVRTLGEPTPADANTLFQIASNSKAFTTASLAMLVDQGRLHWDDKVTEYLPWFQLSDPYVTRELTVRDLVTHRSGLGLGAGDLLWLGSTYTRDQVLHRIRYARVASSFRSKFAYDNVLYAAAGEVIRAITDSSWSEYVTAHILRPLDMTGATTDITAVPAGADLASPHGVVHGTLQIVPRDTVSSIAPAGAIVASVNDMAKWMIVQLDSGRVGDHRLWSAARTRDMWSGNTILPIGNAPPELPAYHMDFAEYGLGWFLYDYRGHKMVTHTGGLAGMTSRVMLFPAQKLGIVVLTNGESPAFDAVALHIADGYLGFTPTDWIGGFAALLQKAHERAAQVEASASTSRDSASGPSLPLAKYAGRYRDKMYGDATIALVNGTLVLSFSHSPDFTGPLEHWQYDTFKTHWRTATIPNAYVTFALNPDGSIATMTMQAVSPLADFSYDYQDLEFHPVADAAGK